MTPDIKEVYIKMTVEAKMNYLPQSTQTGQQSYLEATLVERFACLGQFLNPDKNGVKKA